MESNKSTTTFIFGFLIFLLIIFVTNPPIKGVILTYAVLLGASYFSYLFATFKNTIIGLKFNGNPLKRSVFFGIILGAGFYLTTRLIPGFSIGLPILPQSISDNFRLFVIIGIAPIVEEIFFRGVVLGYLRSIFKKEWYPIIISSLLFALAHLGAYLLGLYDYPSFTVGLTAFYANISAFASAFIFGLVASWFVLRDGIKNLVFAIILHSLVNLIIFTSLSVLIV